MTRQSIPRTTTGDVQRLARRIDEIGRRVVAPGDTSAVGPRGVIARGRRVGNLYPVVGATRWPVMGLSVAVEARRLYRIEASFGAWADGTPATLADTWIHYVLGGGVATVASAELAHSTAWVEGSGFVTHCGLVDEFTVATDTTLSLLLAFQGFQGGRNFGVFCNGDLPGRLVVTDMGQDPADTATRY